jgi:hypothetical protein
MILTIEFISLAFSLFLLVAFLYSTVGHAGASGYLAVMALLSFPITSIKSTSLILNIVVASIASYKYIKSGFFDKKVFLTFAVSSIPAAFIGGTLSIDIQIFKLMAGIFLIASSILLVLKKYFSTQTVAEKPVPLWLGIILGACIGLFSGMIGVGGGIFLSPLMILLNWVSVRKASGVSALFILCNSIVGMAGHLSAVGTLDSTVFLWIAAVAIGGFLGAHFGSSTTSRGNLSEQVIVAFLFIVLFSAGVKFVFIG